MDAGFIDLDILLTRIRNSQSKVYFLDAVKAYKAGALRASLTSAWVALVYDLITKYRELSALGDAAATAFIHSWDTATAAGDIQRLLHLEATILDDATNNTQVVNRIARTHLERLREDRHQPRVGYDRSVQQHLTDDRPVKIAVELPAAVHRDLVAYAEVLAHEHGQTVEPAKLVPLMLARFMSTDHVFIRARRAKSGPK